MTECAIHTGEYDNHADCLVCRVDALQVKLAEVAELVYGDICECNRIPDGGYPEQCLVCSLKQVLSEQTIAT